MTKYIPINRQTPDFLESREKITLPTRKIKSLEKFENLTIEPLQSPEIYQCPYCAGKNVVKRGTRKKKYEIQQRYLCNDCQRSFVPQKVKGKSFPLKLILDGIMHCLQNNSCILRKMSTDACLSLPAGWGREEKKQISTDISENICANLASFNLCQSVQGYQSLNRNPLFN